MNIYVGNLSTAITESRLQDLFSGYGTVSSVKVIKDRFTNEPRGFAFVEMETREAGEEAINSLNESSLDSRFITVNEAKPKREHAVSYNDRY